MPLDADKLLNELLDKAKNGDAYDDFLFFASSKLAAENLHFIAAVDSYKAGKATAADVFDSYVRIKTDEEIEREKNKEKPHEQKHYLPPINISAATRTAITANLESAPKNLFDGAVRECKQLLKMNFLSNMDGWLGTENGKSLFDALGGEAKFGAL